MEKNDIARPISTILDGTNYITWALQMSSFLIGRKLWRIVTGDNSKLIKRTPLVKNPVRTTLTIMMQILLISLSMKLL